MIGQILKLVVIPSLKKKSKVHGLVSIYRMQVWLLLHLLHKMCLGREGGGGGKGMGAVPAQLDQRQHSAPSVSEAHTQDHTLVRVQFL